MKIKILKINIFSNFNIICGVTEANMELFPNTGLSFASNEVYANYYFDEHLKIFSSEIGLNKNRIKYMNQVHGDNIEVIHPESGIKDADAMITTEKNLMLLIKVADCAGILIFDPVKEIIAAVHSGWKGTSLNIIGKTIDKLIQNFGCCSSDILVYISPCASFKNYEVEFDVARHFPKSTHQISSTKYLFDNRNEILNQLYSRSIPKENVEVSDICTIEDRNYHSFRRDRELSGRMGAFISMK